MYPNFPQVIIDTYNKGNRRSIDGKPVKEILSASLVAPLGEVVSTQYFSIRAAVSQMLMALAGTFLKDLFEAHIPLEEGKLMPQLEAYGPRMRQRVPSLIAELQKNPWSDRAMLYFAALDDQDGEVPLLTSLQFHRRNGVLHAIANFRTLDAVRDLPYYMVLIGGITQAVARAVHPGLQVGTLMVQAGTLSVHREDYHAKELGVTTEVQTAMLMLPSEPQDWTSIQKWAKQQLASVIASDTAPGVVIRSSVLSTSTPWDRPAQEEEPSPIRLLPSNAAIH